VVSAGVIGNVVEWYDFAVYGFFAPILAEQFSPARRP
jgi:MHS family proline/betaine transporter-like MFS transporter